MNYDERILSTRQTIDALVLSDLKQNIYTNGTPYIKFLFFPIVIEYLGACIDSYPFDDNGHSEKRFNASLKKLFPEKYKKFTKSNSHFYLYTGFRCNLIHRLVPEKFALTTREEARIDGNIHLELEIFREEKICLVLEDFYDDIERAAKRLLKLYDSGKAPKQKGNEKQIRITTTQLVQ